MNRLSPVVASLLALAACQSLPPLPEALPIHDTFAITYDGRVGPLTSEAFGEVAPADAAARAPAPTVLFHFTVLELPLDEARHLMPALVSDAPPPVELLPDGSERRWGERRVNTGTFEPDGFFGGSVPRVRALGMQGGHVDSLALRQAIRALQQRGRVRDEAYGPVAVGGAATMAAVTRMTFVRALHFAAVHDSFLCDDIELGHFDHGDQVRCQVQQDGDGFAIDLDWEQRWPVAPLPVGGSLQLPVLTHHRVTASTKTKSGDGLVLGALPGREDGNVQLLCVEVSGAPAIDPLR